MGAHINWLAVVAAAAVTFGLGGLWYSPLLFGRAWLAASGANPGAPGAGSPPFLTAFVLSLVMSANLAMFLAAGTPTLGWGAAAGFLAGFGWVTLAIAIIARFERRSWTYVLINGGYMTTSFVLMGVVLAAWR